MCVEAPSLYGRCVLSVSLPPTHHLPFPSLSFTIESLSLSLSHREAAPLQCLPQFASFLGERCQLRPSWSYPSSWWLLSSHIYSCLCVCVQLPPCFPQFFAGAGVVPAYVPTGLSNVCCRGSGEQMVRYVSPCRGWALQSAASCTMGFLKHSHYNTIDILLLLVLLAHTHTVSSSLYTVAFVSPLTALSLCDFLNI